MSRTPRRVALVVCSVLVLSGCGSPVRTGAAAVVGDDRITTSQLQQAIEHNATGADQPVGQLAAAARLALKVLISRDVLAAAARAQGVSVTPGQVDAVLDRLTAQAGGLEALQTTAATKGIGKADLRAAVSDIALQDALAEKLTAGVAVDDAKLKAAYQAGIAQFDRVHVAHIAVGDKALAMRVLAAAKAAPNTFPALAAKYSLDTQTKDQGGDVGIQGRGTLPPAIDAALFSNPPGSVVLVAANGSYEILRILQRTTTSFEQAKPELRKAVLGQRGVTAVQELLRTTAVRLGVRVNPRYGHWNAKSQDIVDLNNGVSRPEGGAPAPTATAVPSS